VTTVGLPDLAVRESRERVRIPDVRRQGAVRAQPRRLARQPRSLWDLKGLREGRPPL